MSQALLLTCRPFEGCAVLTLNRPEAANALSLALRRELVATLSELDDDPTVRVLVLTGAGKTFCSGLDLKELRASEYPSVLVSSAHDTDPVRALRRFRGPVIAAINGAAITGGFELALSCDVLIASSNACFADTHARVGVIPGWGLSQLLPRLIGTYRAKELALTGNLIDAAMADAWGLTNRVVAPEELLPQCLQIARDMLSTSPLMLYHYKCLIDDGLRESLGDALVLEASRSRAHSSSLRVDSSFDQRADHMLVNGKRMG